MVIKVRIPTPLQKLTQSQAEVEVSAESIQSLIQELDRAYPGIKERVCDDSGNVRRFINIFLNEEDIRFLEKEKTALKDGDEVSILPAIAGG
jgi:sulfur-carrier protein